jgi:hypothetical protein
MRHFTQDKKDVTKREIARLLDVVFIKEVYHPDWLANPILVPKKNKNRRMCATTHAKKIHSACLELMKSWNPQQAAAF